MPTRLAALFAGLLLSAFAASASAQTLPEIQRLMKQGELPQALEKVDAYIAGKPRDAQGHFLKGLILTNMQRPADAIAVFTRLTEEFPELPEPYNNLAVLQAGQKQYDKALAALEMAIRIHPDYAVAYENLGDVHAKLAERAYGKVLQLEPSNAAARKKRSIVSELIVAPQRQDAKTLP